MFFVNHSTKRLILDYESVVEKKTALLAALNAKDRFETLVILDSRGVEVVAAEVLSLVGEEDGFSEIKLEIFPEEPDLPAFFAQAFSRYAKEGNCASYDSVVVSEDSTCIEIAHSNPVGTVLFSKEFSKDQIAIGPDHVMDNWSHLEKILSGEYLGYLGEIDVGASYSPLNSSKALGMMHKIKNEKLPQCPVYFGGRYLITADSTSKRHLYSKQLLIAKNNPSTHGKHFSHVIDSLLTYVSNDEKLSDFRICYVPKKPSAETDHLGLLLADMSNLKRKIENLLVCIKDFPPQKTIASHTHRAENVKDAFALSKGVSVKGQNFVLIDDIGSSLSTISECAKTLLHAGAEKVSLLCLAISVRPSDLQVVDLACQKCGMPVVTRFNKKDGSPFWACSNMDAYQKGEKDHCIFDYKKGLGKLRDLERTMFAEEMPF